MEETSERGVCVWEPAQRKGMSRKEVFTSERASDLRAPLPAGAGSPSRARARGPR